MDSKSALFLITKILRIHGKTQRQGGVPDLLFLNQDMVCICLAKNVAFHNPWFYLSQTEVFESPGFFF